MRLRISFCAVLICAAASLVVAQSATRAIMVTVLGKDGVALRDLAPGDFIVQEDGQRREVQSAALSTEPLAVTLMIDMSRMGGVDLPLRDIRAGMTALAKAIYADNPESKVALMDYSGAAVTTVSLTSNGDQLIKATNRLTTSQRAYGVMLEGLVDVAKDIAKVPIQRRAIVAVSFDAPESSRNQPGDVALAVQKTGAAFWAVSIGQNTSPLRDVVLENLPPVTGGLRLTALSPTGLEKMLTDIGTALTSQYVVTYKVPEGSSATVIQAGARKGDKVLRASWMK